MTIHPCLKLRLRTEQERKNKNSHGHEWPTQQVNLNKIIRSAYLKTPKYILFFSQASLTQFLFMKVPQRTLADYYSPS